LFYTTYIIPPKQTNWDSFRTYIDEHINLNLRIKEPQELDEVTQHFTTVIQAAGWHSTPSIAEKRNDESNNVPESWLPENDKREADGRGRGIMKIGLPTTD
jgi:hypothetical protein